MAAVGLFEFFLYFIFSSRCVVCFRFLERMLEDVWKLLFYSILFFFDPAADALDGRIGFFWIA